LLGNVLASADSNQSEEIAWLVLKREEMEKYDIDIEEKKRQFRDDDITERFDLESHYGGDAGARAD
jgi:hypothetical protein